MKLSTLFASIDSNTARNSANVCFRSVHTSLLGSIVNQLVRDFHQDNVLKPRDETDEKLAGLKSLELIAELEAKEQQIDPESIGSPYSAPINTTLTLEQKFCIMRVVETSAKRTAAVGNRFERPMDLGSWLRFILGASASNSAAREALTAAISDEFGVSRDDVNMLANAAIANERRRIDQAVPHIITEFKRLDRMYPRVGDYDDLDNVVFPDSVDRAGEESDAERYWSYVFATKIVNKMCTGIDKTVNNALKFTNLNMLTDARLMKGDIKFLITLFQSAEADAGDILDMLGEFDIPMVDSRAIERHMK